MQASNAQFRLNFAKDRCEYKMNDKSFSSFKIIQINGFNLNANCSLDEAQHTAIM